VIEDQVRGADGALIEGFIHFAPSWEAERRGDAEVLLTQRDARITVRIEGPRNWSLHRADRSPVCGWRSPGFNQVVEAWSLRLADHNYDGRTWRLMLRPEW
jgi:hypothetical protein